jgi:hypothetical protein
MYTRRIFTNKIQLLIVKPHVSAQLVINHFDLTCTTNFYDFGYNVTDNSSLYISHLNHLNSQKMEINKLYIKWLCNPEKRDKATNGTLTMANIARIRKVSYINIHYGNKNFL